MLHRLIGEDIELITKLNSQIGKVKVDQSQLEQAIMNMAVDSRDAMPHGGRLTIQTDNFQLDGSAARNFQYQVTEGPYVRLMITDDGEGIDSETLARVFEPFFTTKEKGKGTGLGLAMVYGFVKQSGGYIDISSEVGVGTALKIYLPRIIPELSEDETRGAPQEVLNGRATVLVVEDDGPLRQLTVRLLESLGYKVFEAEDASSALAVSDSVAEQIDLLLTDVVLPKINGRALATLLLEKRPSLHVLFTSGYTGQSIASETILEENCHFLPKPYTRNALSLKVHEAMEIEPRLRRHLPLIGNKISTEVFHEETSDN